MAEGGTMGMDFGALLQHESPEAMVVTAPAGDIVWWTAAAEALFGYTAGEALGQTLAALLVPAGLLAAVAQADTALLFDTLRGVGGTLEALRRTRNGAMMCIESSTKAVRNERGHVEYILWSKKDVTQRKVAREARLVEGKFGDLLELTPDAIVMANACGRIVLANAQAEALFGYARGELRGCALESLLPARLRHSHLRQRSAYLDQASPQPRAMGAGRDLFGLRKNNDEFPVEVSLSPLQTEEGPLTISAIRDTSERRRIEQALHDKNVELENANRAKDHFLTSMSHELRTPLNSIIGFTGTLLMKLPGPLNVDQERQLRTVQGSARHLLSLINDLLDLTKISTGKVTLTAETLACQPLIEELLLVFRPQARKKGLRLLFDAPDAVVTLSADRRAVQQILMNLLNNAIKYTETGEIRVTLLQIAVRERDSVAVSISDSGRGIAADGQARLFQAFTQFDSPAPASFEGAGLGLHLSQKLAGLMGGEVRCDSEYGVGSVFTLVLPQCAS